MGFRLFKKFQKLKMKMKQYDADEAGGYSDAVPVKPRFSKDCIIPGSGTKLRWQLECYDICREMQRQNQGIQQTSRYIDFILF